MRVAILVLTLLGVASSNAALSQAVEMGDAPVFSSAVPAMAMSHPGMVLQEFTAPALQDGAAASRAALGKSAAATPDKTGSTKTGSTRNGPAKTAKFHDSALAPRLRSPSAATPIRTSLTATGAMAGRGASLIQPHAGVRAYGQPSRSWSDHVLTGVVALMLIAYQLRRKHRVLRPHPFTN